MTIKQAIEQLEDLKIDRESFINYDTESDDVFIKDIKAIETVLSYLSGKLEKEGEVMSCKKCNSDCSENYYKTSEGKIICEEYCCFKRSRA